MPFTISHAVLAPPISKLTGHALPVAALAIGCMVPDLYRLFTQENSNTTHLWTSIIHPDLWIGFSLIIGFLQAFIFTMLTIVALSPVFKALHN